MTIGIRPLFIRVTPSWAALGLENWNAYTPILRAGRAPRRIKCRNPGAVDDHIGNAYAASLK